MFQLSASVFFQDPCIFHRGIFQFLSTRRFLLDLVSIFRCSNSPRFSFIEFIFDIIFISEIVVKSELIRSTYADDSASKFRQVEICTLSSQAVVNIGFLDILRRHILFYRQPICSLCDNNKDFKSLISLRNVADSSTTISLLIFSKSTLLMQIFFRQELNGIIHSRVILLTSITMPFL